jgi:hypothetical protein
VSEPTSGVVDNLVTQFSNATDCFRELVQNSIDAGSPVIEVWTEFERGEDYLGTISVHVDDFGEGMDEEIIDGQLTKLFASKKENDLTKIGKFGIGFVSIFAMDPKGVLLHTGRGGEYWEVFFHPDRTFQTTPLDHPVEGTQITLYFEGDRHRYDELADGVRRALKHWCNQSEAEITFEDRSPVDGAMPELETVNAPFDVEGLCMTRVVHQGTEIVLSYQDRPAYGFYNRGLTLAYSSSADDVIFGRASRYRRIGFKIKSRYLEHTLSRETVMRDENYEKAMALIDEAASGPLADALVAELVETVAKERWDVRDLRRYVRLMGYLALEPPQVVARLRDEPILRLVTGEAIGLARLEEIYDDNGRIYFSPEIDDLDRVVSDSGIPVILGRIGPGSEEATAGLHLQNVNRVVVRWLAEAKRQTVSEHFRNLLNAVGIWSFDPLSARLQTHFVRPEDVYLDIDVDDEIPQGMQAWVAETARILDKIGRPFRTVTTGRSMMSPGGEEDAGRPIFVVGAKISGKMALPPTTVERTKKLVAVIDREHPHVRALAPLLATHPDLAVYCLAKSLLLQRDEKLDLDLELMMAAREGVRQLAP